MRKACIGWLKHDRIVKGERSFKSHGRVGPYVLALAAAASVSGSDTRSSQ
jgi:hypothetical protein